MTTNDEEPKDILKGENIKGDEDMTKITSIEYPKTRKTKIESALKEVEMIKSEKFPRKTARDFLKESQNK